MTWQLWAHEKDGRFFHVGSKRFVEFHGLKDPIVPVIVEITGTGVGGVSDYYGWQDVDEYEQIPCMIWQSWACFNICFAYGAQAEVDRGRGRIVRLSITKSG
jgi:hypothetical protein